MSRNLLLSPPRPCVSGLILALALGTGIAPAASLDVTVSQDTYIRIDAGGGTSPQNSDADNEVLVGQNFAVDQLRPLLGFDVSQLTDDVANLGGGDFGSLTINSATLTLYERRGRSFEGTGSLNVRSYDFDFIDLSSTWADPDGDGSPATGDTTAGGTLGALLANAVLGWDATADNDNSSLPLDVNALSTAIENAATPGTLNLIRQSPTYSSFGSSTSDRSANTARHASLSIDYSVNSVDPTFGLSVASPDADLAFPAVYQTGGNQTRTLLYEVTSGSGTGTVTVDSISVLPAPDSSGAFTLGTINPAVGSTLGDGDTLSIEVIANGSTAGAFSGTLVIDTTTVGTAPADGYDTEVPLNSTIYAVGQRFGTNPYMDVSLAGWDGGATSVTPGIAPGSAGMARIKGVMDPEAGAPDALAQSTTIPDGSSDFQVTAFFTPTSVASFADYTGNAADGSFQDRTFQWVLFADDAAAPNPGFGDAEAGSTLINLAYLPDGNATSGTPDFHVFDGVSWIPLGIGAIDGSVDNGASAGDGALDPTSDPLDVINVYRLTVTGSGFGTPGASYEVNVEKVSGADSFSSGSATGLTTFHGVSGTTSTPAGHAFITSDTSSSSNANGGFATSFWVDDASFFNGTAPDPLLSVLAVPTDAQAFLPDTTASATFTVRNDGATASIDLDSVTFGDPAFSVVSPSLPATLNPGATAVVEIACDLSSATPGVPLSTSIGVTTTPASSPDGFDWTCTLIDPSQLLANGDFETGDLSGWTGTGFSIESTTPITGVHSATSTGLGDFGQTFGDLTISNGSLSFDFRIDSAGTDRSLHFRLNPPGGGDLLTGRVTSAGELQFFNGVGWEGPDGWQTTGITGIATGVNYNLTLDFHGVGTAAASYDVHLVGGAINTSLTGFDQFHGNALLLELGGLQFRRTDAGRGTYTVDNVVVDLNLNPDLEISVESVSGGPGSFTLNWTTVPASQPCRVMLSTDGMQTFQEIASGITGGTYTATGSDAPAGKAFYRIETE